MAYLGALVLLLMWFCPAEVRGANAVLIPAGQFKMPAVLNKKSIVVKSFYMDAHPVTNADFLKFVREHPEWRKSKVKSLFADSNYLSYWPDDLSIGDSKTKDSPVVRISWFAAREYCAQKGMRLPTIEEWEYAALGPIKNVSSVQAVILEWYGAGAEWPLPAVMKKDANSYGVYDLHGLIWEWVEDFNSSLVTGESRADGSLDKNMFCGAGASGAADPGDYAAFMRYAFRSSLQAKYTVQSLGFRCAKDKEKE